MVEEQGKVPNSDGPLMRLNFTQPRHLASDPVHAVDDVVPNLIKGLRLKSLPKSIHLLRSHDFSVLPADVVVAGHHDPLRVGKRVNQGN